MDAKDLVKKVKEDNVKFISLQFSDVTGAVKSVDMPVRHLEDTLKDGAWFDGSSMEGFARIPESDMYLMPDLATFNVIPWEMDLSTAEIALEGATYGRDRIPVPDPMALADQAWPACAP